MVSFSLPPKLMGCLASLLLILGTPKPSRIWIFQFITSLSFSPMKFFSQLFPCVHTRLFHIVVYCLGLLDVVIISVFFMGCS
jgi:hypothetical protein